MTEREDGDHTEATGLDFVRRTENGDYLLGVLTGAQVDSVRLNVQAELHFSVIRAGARERVAKLKIGEAFHVFDGTERHPAYFGPPGDGPPYGLDVLARLVQAIAIGGIAFATGALEVEFSNGWRIEVPFGEQYEAWEFWCSGGPLISRPGGGLS